MKTLVVIPSWLLTNMMTPYLPEWHEWRGRHFTLEDWSRCATPLCVQLSLSMWYGVYVWLVIVVWLLLDS